MSLIILLAVGAFVAWVWSGIVAHDRRVREAAAAEYERQRRAAEEKARQDKARRDAADAAFVAWSATLTRNQHTELTQMTLAKAEIMRAGRPY